ncbi:hypothetical protein RUM43_011897 [Polyplax serrata]|uniref:Uncharacterized protein n=1 Tax=Polyplax serrata TaxID=468196 RepID=A0AAN8P2T4_POLSC
MATTSTEAVTNSTHQTYRLGAGIVNGTREKIWNGDIVATASTHGFWEPDKEFKIKVKVDELKRKFHQSRYLQVKHLPRDVSESVDSSRASRNNLAILGNKKVQGPKTVVEVIMGPVCVDFLPGLTLLVIRGRYPSRCSSVTCISLMMPDDARWVEAPSAIVFFVCLEKIP